jgi:hypothetical protein
MTPYDKYKSTEEWRIIHKSVQELMDNNDIKLLTPNDYVIGYIVKQLVEKEQTSLNRYNKVE